MRIRLIHLAAILGFSILLTSVGGVVATWLAVDDELSELLYEDIHQQARLLGQLINQGHIEPDELEAFLNTSFQDDGEDTFLIAIEHLTGDWYASNFGLPRGFGSSRTGPIRRQHLGHDWQGYQLREGELLVQLLRRTDLAEDIKGDVAEDILVPILIGNGISLVLLLLLLGLTTQPLARLTRLLQQRNGNDLLPIRIKSPVQEMQQVVASLNRLMAGIEQTLEREKRFASDVAHELRTPLSTLKLELSLPEPEIPVLRQEVTRLIRVVEQLLTLARLEGSRWHQSFGRLELGAHLQTLISRLQPMFDKAGVQLDYQPRTAWVQADPTLLSLLVENLLLNALRHAIGADRVQLLLEPVAGGWQLQVVDNGQGMPADQCKRMTEPFTRMDQRGEGLGLGLAICQQIAQVHATQLVFTDAKPGLQVTLQLPAVPAS